MISELEERSPGQPCMASSNVSRSSSEMASAYTILKCSIMAVMQDTYFSMGLLVELPRLQSIPQQESSSQLALVLRAGPLTFLALNIKHQMPTHELKLAVQTLQARSIVKVHAKVQNAASTAGQSDVQSGRRQTRGFTTSQCDESQSRVSKQVQQVTMSSTSGEMQTARSGACSSIAIRIPCITA